MWNFVWHLEIYPLINLSYISYTDCKLSSIMKLFENYLKRLFSSKFWSQKITNSLLHVKKKKKWEDSPLSLKKNCYYKKYNSNTIENKKYCWYLVNIIITKEKIHKIKIMTNIYLKDFLPKSGDKFLLYAGTRQHILVTILHTVYISYITCNLLILLNMHSTILFWKSYYLI